MSLSKLGHKEYENIIDAINGRSYEQSVVATALKKIVVGSAIRPDFASDFKDIPSNVRSLQLDRLWSLWLVDSHQVACDAAWEAYWRVMVGAKKTMPRPVGSKQNTSSDLLDDEAAAALLDVSPGTLSVWRSTGRYNLPFLKIGRKVRYRRADLEAWMADRLRESGSTK